MQLVDLLRRITTSAATPATSSRREALSAPRGIVAETKGNHPRGATIVPEKRNRPEPIIDDEDIDLDAEVIHVGDGVRLTDELTDELSR